MPANNSKLTYDQFMEAELTRARIRAHAWWTQNMEGQRPVERQAPQSEWMDFAELQSHTGRGETTIRGWIEGSKFPAGKKVGGKLTWKRSSVDRAMDKLFKEGE